MYSNATRLLSSAGRVDDLAAIVSAVVNHLDVVSLVSYGGCRVIASSQTVELCDATKALSRADAMLSYISTSLNSAICIVGRNGCVNTCSACTSSDAHACCCSLCDSGNMESKESVSSL